MIYKAFFLDIESDRMNEAPNETRTHSWRFDCLTCKWLHHPLHPNFAYCRRFLISPSNFISHSDLYLCSGSFGRYQFYHWLVLCRYKLAHLLQWYLLIYFFNNLFTISISTLIFFFQCSFFRDGNVVFFSIIVFFFFFCFNCKFFSFLY